MAGTARATVVVMGDLGRSPRMQNHALALADAGFEVDVVALSGTPPRPRLARHPAVRLHLLRARERAAGAPLGRRLFRAIAHGLWLLAVLLFRARRPQVLLMQVPPAFPSAAAVALAGRARSAAVVFDWHNFGDSVLALEKDRRHPAVRLLGWWERTVAGWADLHVCVSEAMRLALARRGVPEALVLPDLPAEGFRVPEAGGREQARRALARWLEDGTGRPTALVVSPTSWTLDEDLSLLLDAAGWLDRRLLAEPKGSATLPRIVVAITGRGPARAPFEAALGQRSFQSLEFRTVWLSSERYRRLLGAADLGLCLHRSSSGADLPIKLAEMFGCGLPVCALDYGGALGERLRHGENGLVFRDGAELGHQLWELLAGFPAGAATLARLRDRVEAHPLPGWTATWSDRLLPRLREVAG